jgi:cation diffusion facilitator CzcD-associated flavoprotein CzcO
MDTTTLPVAIIGAGPVGLAAAAHLIQRGETPIVFESGAEIAASVRSWGHVRLFSPWRWCVDQAAAASSAQKRVSQ